MNFLNSVRPRSIWHRFMAAPLYQKLALVAVFVAPFQYALTLEVGFPLKLSEILIAGAAVARLWILVIRHRVPKLGIDVYLVGVIAITVILSTVLTLASRELDDRVSGIDRPLWLDASMYGAYGVVICVAWLLLRETDVTLLRDALIQSIWLCLAAVIAQAVFLTIAQPQMLEALGFDMRRRGQPLLGVQLARSGPFLEGQHLGFYAGVIAVLALASRRWWSGAAALVCVLYSQSTTGVLGLAASALVYVILRPNRRTLFVAAGVVAAGGIAIGVIPQLRHAAVFQMSKLGLLPSSPGVNATQSIDVRGIKSEIGWRMMIDNPIIGVGPGRYSYEFPKYSHQYHLPEYYYTADIRAIAENGYMQLGAEYGILALAAFFALLCWLFIVFTRQRSLLAAVVAFVAVGFATQSSWTFIPIWTAIGFLCAAALQGAPIARVGRVRNAKGARGDAEASAATRTDEG